MRVIVVAISLIFSGAAVHSETSPTTLVCEFGEGSKINLSSENKVSVEAATDPQTLIFNGLEKGSSAGKYRNVSFGWEGNTLVQNNGFRIDILESNNSDKGFAVTIFHRKRIGKKVPALLSQHSFDLESPKFLPFQVLGTCQ